MRTIISFIPFLIFFACGSSGIEGYVDEPITITAENPEEGKDVVARFLSGSPGYVLEEEVLTAPPSDQEDSFYAARIRREKK